MGGGGGVVAPEGREDAEADMRLRVEVRDRKGDKKQKGEDTTRTPPSPVPSSPRYRTSKGGEQKVNAPPPQSFFTPHIHTVCKSASQKFEGRQQNKRSCSQKSALSHCRFLTVIDWTFREQEQKKYKIKSHIQNERNKKNKPN